MRLDLRAAAGTPAPPLGGLHRSMTSFPAIPCILGLPLTRHIYRRPAIRTE